MNLSKYRSNADSSMMQEDASVIKPSNNSCQRFCVKLIVYIQKDSDRSLLLGDEDAQTVNDFMFFQKNNSNENQEKVIKTNALSHAPCRWAAVGVNS